MKFSFDIKHMCKILAHECNNQLLTRENCPTGGTHMCPFKDGVYPQCKDITWKDWRDLFNEKVSD